MRAATATKPKKIDAYRKEPSVNKKYLPYSYHLNDYVISMENGDLMAFFKLDGRTHDCASDRELVTWHKDLNTLVKSFGTDHVELWTHEYHHEAKEYPDGEYDHFFPAYVDQYNRKLHGDSKQLINDLYLTVIYKQVGDKTQKFLAKFEKPTRDEIQRMQNEALEGLEDISEQILEAMKPYGIQQLGIYYRDKRGVEIPAPDKKEREELAEVDESDIFDEAIVIERNEPEPSQAHAYSKALEFLYFLANMEWAIVPVCRDRSGISAGVADAARSTGSSMQALGNMGSHGMFGGNAFRGGNSGGGQQSAGGGSGSNSGGSSGSNLSGKARGSRGKKAA